MNTSQPQNLSTLLRDAQALIDTAIEKALKDAGSNRRELRLLERIAAGTNSARIDRHIQHPGSLSATFAARGWIEYAEGAWRLTATGVSEFDRLGRVISDTTTQATGPDSTLSNDLSALVEKLGGTEAAHEARHALRRERQQGKHRCGHPFADRSGHEHERSNPRGDFRPFPGGFPFANSPFQGEHGQRQRSHRGQRNEFRGERRDPRFDGQPERPFNPFNGPRFTDGDRRGGSDFDSAIRDLGRGIAPLMPFLREAFLRQNDASPRPNDDPRRPAAPKPGEHGDRREDKRESDDQR